MKLLGVIKVYSTVKAGSGFRTSLLYIVDCIDPDVVTIVFASQPRWTGSQQLLVATIQ